MDNITTIQQNNQLQSSFATSSTKIDDNDDPDADSENNKTVDGAKEVIAKAVVITKSDLNNNDAELFNKLTSNQSQRMIVTNSSSIKDKSENLYRTNSLNATCKPNKQLQSASFDQQQLTKFNDYNSSNNIKLNNYVSKQQQQQQQQLASTIDQPNLSDFKCGQVVFSNSRSRWYTNEEVASILTNFNSHPEWQMNELQIRPKSGAVLLYSREKVRYRQDGYCWKKRKNGRTTREDHMKLKVQGIECIYGCYVHSAILPTFHRRCYWLLQNPDIVLVHYLNQPPDDQSKMMITFNPSLLEADTKRSWTNEEIIEEIGSVFGGISQIQHMLNINFPPNTATVIHSTSQHKDQSSSQQQNQISADESSKLIESSLKSKTTTMSDAMSDRLEMIQDQQMNLLHSSKQLCEHNAAVTSSKEQQDNCVNECRDDEMMNAISCQDGDELSRIVITDNLNSSSKLGCDILYNGQGNLERNPVTMSMTIDTNNESLENSSVTNSVCDDQLRISNTDCYNYADANIVDRTVKNSNNISKQTSRGQIQGEEHMEQNPCSPVTQIYNKIVDDIETYALPLEPSHFDSNHHHLLQHDLSISSLPVQSAMDIVNETDCHHYQQIDLQQHCIQERDQQHRHQLQHDLNQHGHLAQQYSDCSETNNVGDCCCDIFGDHRDSSSSRVNSLSGQGENTDGSHNDNEDANLLLNDFDNVHTDPLANVNDLIMMGNNGDDTNLLVDTDNLDLLNFRSIDCAQALQQLDTKSTTSDTDAMARISPVNSVPRCNSTGNAMQSRGFNSRYQHHYQSGQQQHVSNQFLTTSNNHNNSIQGNFEFHKDVYNKTGTYSGITYNNAHHHSSNTNLSSSTSCSVSPLSLQRTEVPSATSSLICNNIQTSNSMTDPTNSNQSFMRLPLQQRQKSEQDNSTGSVISGLLPKALSLDGGDLSITSNRFQINRQQNQLSISPVTYNSVDQQQHHQGLLTISPTQGVRQNQTALNNQAINNVIHNRTNEVQHLNPSSLSNNIPTDTNSEILVRNSIHESSANVQQQSYCENPLTDIPQQRQPVTNSHGCNILTKNVNQIPILDYVPNWCNITGGAKVLIVGNWNQLLTMETSTGESFNRDDPFSAMFDNQLVPAKLIQENVLRCYVPSHEQGFISLRVLFMNCIVSEEVLFEMRPSCNQMNSDNLNSSSSASGQPDRQDPSNFHGNADANLDINYRNPSSSNQANNPSFTLQKPEISPQNNSTSTTKSSISSGAKESSNRVLVLAENIISAMHKKNYFMTRQPSDSRLVNSLDIEMLDNYRGSNVSLRHQQPRSFKGTQRMMAGSRSLSRDSDPLSYGPHYALNIALLDTDPYWHQSASENIGPELMTSFAKEPLASNRSVMGQSSSSIYHLSSDIGFIQAGVNPNQVYQSSEFRNNIQRLNLMTQITSLDNQNLTDTTCSSGLGSIVSSSSPSPTSLHSPSSNCNVLHTNDTQSPCSCERQPGGTPTSADFCEYFQASAETEESFASLTLNDHEQQELYEAAKVIQKAYRTYRGRKRQASELLVGNDEMFQDNSCSFKNEFRQQVTTASQQQQSNLIPQQQACLNSSCNFKQVNYLQQSANLVKCYRDKEMQAATIIQAYYRRYRQYAHFKKQQISSMGKQTMSAPVTKLDSKINPSRAAMSSYNSHNIAQGAPNTAKLVVDTMPIKIEKGITSHVDRKRFKTAILISNVNQTTGGNSRSGADSSNNMLKDRSS